MYTIYSTQSIFCKYIVQELINKNIPKLVAFKTKTVPSYNNSYISACISLNFTLRVCI